MRCSDGVLTGFSVVYVVVVWQAYKQVMDTHSPVPDYFYKNYALACEKMARKSDLSPHDSELYLTEAINNFEIYINSGADDPQMSSIQNAVKSMKQQLWICLIQLITNNSKVQG